MPEKTIPPSIDAKRFSCAHCGAYADQTWHDVYSSKIDDHGTPFLYTAAQAHMHAVQKGVPVDVTREWIMEGVLAESGAVFIQPREPLVLGNGVINLWMSETSSRGRLSVWVHDHVLYPPVQEGVAPNDDLPPDILRDFNEARSIVGLSPRGASALLRLCIQKLCMHFGEPGDNINSDIASLVRKGLDARVQKALDIVRVVGNEAVHPGQIDLNDDRDTANNLFGLVNLIVEKMITEEKHISSLYNALPEDKLKGIEARDRPKT